MSAFDNLGTIQAQRVWDGIAGRSVHGERLTLGVIELDPNGVVPEHSHDNEQLGICLSGSLVFASAASLVSFAPATRGRFRRTFRTMCASVRTARS